MKVFEYKGYQGSIETDAISMCLHGKLLHISDLISYEAATMQELQGAFIESVDDYLQTCSDLNREPQKPYKGVFNVRVKPDLHLKAAIKAARLGITLNELVGDAIEAHVNEYHHLKSDFKKVNVRLFESISKRVNSRMQISHASTNPIHTPQVAKTLKFDFFDSASTTVQ